MPRYRVLPYRQGSRGARALADALPRGRVLKLEGSRYVYRQDDVLINWGSTDTGMFTNILNLGVLVRNASNKLLFFNRMSQAGCGDVIPAFWTRREDIPDDMFPIVCRTVLAGHSGAGIVIANTRAELVNAPLYVKYIKKQQEYRIHMGGRDGQSIIISVQRKARRLDTPDDEVNWAVRNHQNGFVYVRGDVNPPNCVIEAARRCFMATGLDFGAVDVIYNERRDAAYVLEINTAPGLEGQTVEDYANFFTAR